MEQNQNQNVKTPQSWAEVVISSGLSLEAIVEFLNVLNQRLCTLENIVSVPDEEGKHHTITEIYQMQTQETTTQPEVELSQQNTNESVK